MDEQMQDRLQTEYELEEVFCKLLMGVTLTLNEINLLRWAVGFDQIVKSSQVKEMIVKHEAN